MRINLHEHDSGMKGYRVNKKHGIWGGKNVFNPIQSELSSNDLGLIVFACNHLVNFFHINKRRLLILPEGQEYIIMEVRELVSFYVQVNVSNDCFMILAILLKFVLLAFVLALLDGLNLFWDFFNLLGLRRFIGVGSYDWWRDGIQSWVVDGFFICGLFFIFPEFFNKMGRECIFDKIDIVLSFFFIHRINSVPVFVIYLIELIWRN